MLSTLRGGTGVTAAIERVEDHLRDETGTRLVSLENPDHLVVRAEDLKLDQMVAQAETADVDLAAASLELQELFNLQQFTMPSRSVKVKERRINALTFWGIPALPRVVESLLDLDLPPPLPAEFSGRIQIPGLWRPSKTFCLFGNPRDSLFSQKKHTDSIRHSIEASAVVQIVLQHFVTGFGACVRTGGLKLKAAFNFR